MHEDILGTSDRRLLNGLGDGLPDRFGQLGPKFLREGLGDGDILDEDIEIVRRTKMDGRRADEHPKDLVERDAPLEQTEAADQGQLGRRQVRLVGVEQAGEPERLAVLLGRRELKRLGSPPRIAFQELADQPAEMIERQSMGPVRFDQLRERRIIAPDAVPAEQGHRRGTTEPFDITVPVAPADERLQVGQGEPACDQGRRRADALGNPGQ